MTHSGGAFGHYTEYQLYPDIDFGIYMSINGVTGNYDCKTLIVQYVCKYGCRIVDRLVKVKF